MRFSESLANICAALAKVQTEIKNPIKNQENKGVQGKPKYANLEDTLQEYVRPVCAKHGISIFQSVKTGDNGAVGVCTVLFHESGEFIESDYVYCDVIIPVSKEGKKILTEGQATGVCITYLRRYSLNAALGINGDKDSDGTYEEIEEKPLTYESALAFEFNFGKHSGKTLKEVWDTDSQYVEWLVRNEKTDERLREAINLIKEELEKQKQAEVEQKNIENSLISETKVRALITRCESDGVPTERILKYYKIKRFAELTERKFMHIHEHWEDIKKAE